MMYGGVMCIVVAHIVNCLIVCMYLYVRCHKSMEHNVKAAHVSERERDEGREMEMRNDGSGGCNSNEREKNHIRNVGVSMK